MYIKFEVKDAKLVAGKLANIHAEIPRISENTIKKAVEAVVKKMQAYPPQRPGSLYKRTMKLKEGWKVKKLQSGYTVTNNVVYGRYVVGTPEGAIGGGGQAWMHVGRWLLFRDVAEYESSRLPPAVEEHIRLKIKQENMS